MYDCEFYSALVLEDDVSIACDDSKMACSAVGGVFVALYVVGIPCYLLAVLARNASPQGVERHMRRWSCKSAVRHITHTPHVPRPTIRPPYARPARPACCLSHDLAMCLMWQKRDMGQSRQLTPGQITKLISESIERRYSILYDKYHVQHWYWEVSRASRAALCLRASRHCYTHTSTRNSSCSCCVAPP